MHGAVTEEQKETLDRVDDACRPPEQREQRGVGLGLAISRELARAMDGHLTAQSVEGEGSVFTLTLPVA